MSDNRIARRRAVEASRAALRTAALAFLREPPAVPYFDFNDPIPGAKLS